LVQGVTNVKDYGAKGDGVTNDTATINLAIAGLAAGGILYFPPGRYMTNGGHVIDKPCTIIGAGRHQTYNSSSQLYLINGSNADMMTIAKDHTTVRDMTLYGNSANQTGTSNGLVLSLTVATNYFVFDNVWVDSFKGDGFVFQGPSTTLSGIVSKCESRLNTNYGMKFNGSASDIIVSDCYVDQNVQSGIYISASDISLSNCHIWGNGTGSTGYLDGITFVSSAGCRIVNSYIEGNHNGAGIRFATGSLFGHIISGCDIWDNGYQGIYAFTAQRIIISGNQIRHNNYKSASGINGAGIALDACTGFSITGNILFSSTGTKRQTYGYAEQGTTVLSCTFTGNICRASEHLTGATLIGASATPTVSSANVLV
jgi:hypothetical protein